jgi:hypothetical protein
MRPVGQQVDIRYYVSSKREGEDDDGCKIDFRSLGNRRCVCLDHQSENSSVRIGSLIQCACRISPWCSSETP